MAKARTPRKVKAPKAPADRRCLKFSLEYLDLNNPRFQLDGCEAAFFLAFFAEISRYQTFTIDEFREPSQKEHRHSLHFPATTEPAGFAAIDPSEDQGLWTEDAWQFGLPDSKGRYSPSPWRVHGFIDGEHFYIVWFDPRHQLNPSP